MTRLARREHEPHRVVDDRVVDEDLVGDVLQVDERFLREHLLRGGRVDAHPAHDLDLLAARGVADDDLHEEPVALRLGERVDALRLDRVLRREHEERLRDALGDAADRHVALRHHLEQRRLHLGRRRG